MRKLPQHISDEELLAALDSADDTETTEYSSDVPHFLAKFKIDQGSYKVRKSLLYKLYKLYSKEPLTRPMFSTTAAEFIPVSSKNYFSINIPAMKIANVVHTKKQSTKVNFNASLNVKKHYEKFILAVGMDKGTNWVQAEVLHEIYRFYCIDNRMKSRLIQTNFVTVSKLYFEHKRLTESRAMWFKVDKEIVDRLLTKEDQVRLINWRLRVKKQTQELRSDREKENVQREFEVSRAKSEAQLKEQVQ